MRNTRKSIRVLYDEHGIKVEDVVQNKQVAVTFYQKLLGSSNKAHNELEANRISKLLTFQIYFEIKELNGKLRMLR